MAAFQKAFDVGADGIEIDVETTSDGQLIVVNRWFLNQNFGYFPWECLIDVIKENAREKGILIPTFDEVCGLIQARPNSIFNVEIKSSNRGVCKTALQVAKRIQHFGIKRQVIVSSFDVNTLLTMKFNLPDIETAYLFRMEDRVLQLEEKKTARYKFNSFINRSGIKAILTGVNTLHPEVSLLPVRKQRLWQKYAYKAKKRINTWTVDNKEDFDKAVNSGMDIIISDNPGKMIDYRLERNRK